MTLLRPLDHVLFIGDSITDALRDRLDPGSLGDGYVSVVAERLAADPATAGTSVSNRGIGGDRADDLAGRWEPDCIDIAPTVISIHVGINDTWRAFDSGDPTSIEAFEADYRRILDRTRDALGARVVLIDPFVLPVQPGQESWRTDLDPRIDCVHRLAVEYGATLVRADEVFAAAAAAAPGSARLLLHDGVHPTPRGHTLLADAWLEAVQRAVPDAAAHPKVTPKTTRGESSPA